MEIGAPLSAYSAAVGGIAANADCSDAAVHVANEGLLYSARAPAEFLLRFGDWRADLAHADDLLRRCSGFNTLRGTAIERHCRAQLQNNAVARSRMSVRGP